MSDIQVGDEVVILECPLGRHVGALGTVTARDGAWVRVQTRFGAFCEPHRVGRSYVRPQAGSNAELDAETYDTH